MLAIKTATKSALNLLLDYVLDNNLDVSVQLHRSLEDGYCSVWFSPCNFELELAIVPAPTTEEEIPEFELAIARIITNYEKQCGADNI